MSRFSAKNPKDFVPDDALCDRIHDKTQDNRMACATAFGLCKELGVDEARLGHHLNHLDIPLVSCQIGLFGHAEGAKLIKTLDAVEPALEKDILDRLQEGVISCQSVFDLAESHKTSKVHVGSACETLGIKIKHCRFGAF